MAVPDFQSIMRPLLEFASDGDTHSIKEAYEVLAHYFQLSDDDLEELVPSGQNTVFTNRVSWANTYLKKAGLMEAPKRGHLRITPTGLDVLRETTERIDAKFLRQFERFMEFHTRTKASTPSSEDEGNTPTDSTPEENFVAGYKAIREEVETELLDLVKNVSPIRFERLVVDLLVKMGYGGSRADAGRAIGRSGDGGIDGIINEDRLGLDVVYIQAKRWERTVGRPEIQQFAGALQGLRARKGVFITTSEFSTQAREFAANLDSKIILIDGQQLSTLMFDFNTGVSVVDAYEIKKIDSDYFDYE